MRHQSVFLPPLLMTLIVLACLTPVQAQTEKTTTCFAAQNPVVLDGMWTTPEEWQDSEQIVLSAYVGPGIPHEWNGSGTAYARTKHDINFLYVLIDFVSAEKGEKDDGALVMFDCDHDAGSIDNDDVGFDIVWMSPGATKLSAYRGGSTGWVSISVPGSTQGACSLDASNDPYSDLGHPIYELKIPMNLFKGANEIGFSPGVFQHTTRVLMLWPKDRLRVGPETWGELTFSATSVPEFSGLVGPIVVLISACLVLFILRRPRKTDERKTIPTVRAGLSENA